MNALDKARLIKELHGLLHYLDNRSLNLFEIAKTKNRIKQIFSLCDEPIFKKQQLEFKLLLDPKTVSTEFAKSSLYGLSFLGYFNHEAELYEQHASAYHSIGWAFLHSPQKGWQICVYAPQLSTAWHSDWNSLDAAYAQMMQDQALHGLLIDSELIKNQPTTPQHFAPINSEESLSPYVFNEIAEDLATEKTELVEDRKDDSLDESDTVHPRDFEPDSDTVAEASSSSENEPFIESTSEVHSIEMPENSSHAMNTADDILHVDLFNFELETPTSSSQLKTAPVLADIPNTLAPDEIAHIPTTEVSSLESIPLLKLTADVTVLLTDSVKDEALCLLSLQGMPEVSQHVEMLMPLAHIENWQSMPAVIAELLSPNGHFLKYALLFGADEQSHAMRMLNQFCRKQNLTAVAIKEISLALLGMSFTDADLLFNVYQQRAKLFWSADHYHPFISSNQLLTQKFIHFDEAPAEQKTPLLLLQERHKIRVIHGENRMALNSAEMFYPYLMLHRQHDMTWQRIHAAILDLPHPIDVLSLYNALTQDDAY